MVTQTRGRGAKAARVFGGGASLSRETQIHDRIRKTKTVSYKEVREHMRTVMEMAGREGMTIVVEFRGRPMAKISPIK